MYKILTILNLNFIVINFGIVTALLVRSNNKNKRVANKYYTFYAVYSDCSFVRL